MIKFAKDVKLGQVISKEDVSSWVGDVIFSTGTATGKTTFVLTTLSDYCEENNQRILFVCNRKALTDEVKSLIREKNISNIDVTTYQSIESKLKNKQEVMLDYSWICLDEFHHTLEIYNHYTDLSFKYFTNHPAQKIYMSATCEQLFDNFVESGKVKPSQYYYIEKDYNYITKLSFYNRKDDFKLILDEKLKDKDSKILFFTQSLNRALETYIEHRDVSTFFCSSYTKNSMAKKFLKECKGDIQDENFKQQLLISTSALDVGITLKSKDIRTIIIDIFSWQTLVQCLGRKRLIDSLDNCEVYIRNYHRGELNIQHNQHFHAVDLFIHNEEEFNRTYGRERDYKNPYIFHDKDSDKWTINTIAYFSMLQDEEDLDIMKNQYWVDDIFEHHKGLGYKNFILDKMKIERYDERIEDYDREKDVAHMYNLNEYLESIVGTVMLVAKDREELIGYINVRDGKNNRLLKSINTLNSYLAERKYNYIIREFETSRTVDGKKKNYKSAWKVLKLIE